MVRCHFGGNLFDTKNKLVNIWGMIFSKNTKVYIFSLVTWLVPFVVSLFLVNPQTKEYYPNYIGFKLIMFVILSSITYLLMKKILAKKHESKWKVANTFLLVNIIVDLALLVGLFGVTFVSWLTTILPVYIVVFYGVEHLLHKKNHNNAAVKSK
jgi:hypothetical protein